MSLLTLVHVTSGTFAFVAGAAVLALSAGPRPAWVAACGLACVVTLGTSATALTLQSRSSAPAAYVAETVPGFAPARSSKGPSGAAREPTEFPRSAPASVCRLVL